MALLTILIYVVVLAIVFGLLYLVVRAAILSALAEDRRRQARIGARPTPQTHLDADGL
jgi:heme exporter protein D